MDMQKAGVVPISAWKERSKFLLWRGRNKSVVLTTEKLKELLPQILKSIKFFTIRHHYLIFFSIQFQMQIRSRTRSEKAIRRKYPNLVIKSSGSLVSNLRSVKSNDELMLMQKAVVSQFEL